MIHGHIDGVIEAKDQVVEGFAFAPYQGCDHAVWVCGNRRRNTVFNTPRLDSDRRLWHTNLGCARLLNDNKDGMDPMKDLCSRARAALNLILVLALLQVWVIFSAPDSAESIDKDLGVLYEFFSGYRYNSDNPQFPKPKPSLDKLVVDLNGNTPDPDGVTLGPFTSIQILGLEQELSNAKAAQIEGNRALRASNSAKEGVAEKTGDRFIDEARDYLDASKTKEAIEHIQKLARKSGLAPTATIRELKRYYTKDMEAPILKQSMERNEAIVVFEIASVFPLIFLFIVLDSMRITLKKMKVDGEDIDLLDCILFYRSWTAIPCSLIWLLSPLVCMATQIDGIYRRTDTAGALFAQRFIVWTTPFLVGFCIHRAWNARQLYLAISASKKRDDSNEEDDDGEDEDESG